jgi:predicted metalloprotease with PDZ domain
MNMNTRTMTEQATSARARARAKLHYRIEALNPQAHLFGVSLRIHQPTAHQLVSLPVWIPGSYLVREFAKHLQHLSAQQHGKAVRIEQRSKSTWQVQCDAAAPLHLSWQVYAFDASVRTAWLDNSRGFFNGTSATVGTWPLPCPG